MAQRKALVHTGGRLEELPSSDTLTGVVHSTTVTKIVTITQAAYDLLAPPDPNTLYLITA